MGPIGPIRGGTGLAGVFLQQIAESEVNSAPPHRYKTRSSSPHFDHPTIFLTLQSYLASLTLSGRCWATLREFPKYHGAQRQFYYPSSTRGHVRDLTFPLVRHAQF